MALSNYMACGRSLLHAWHAVGLQGWHVHVHVPSVLFALMVSCCFCMCVQGMTNTTTLVPCASLFTPTPTNTTLRIPSTPTTPLITASSGTPQAANTTTTPTTDTASTTANNMTANSTTAGVAAGSGTSGNISVVESVSGVSVGVHGTLAYYEYDYDVQECDTSGQCPVVGVGEGGVVVTEAAGGDVRRGVQQAVARAISQFTRPPDNTPTTTNQPRMPSLRSGAAVTVSSTATGSVASPTLQRKCSNTTVTLLRTLSECHGEEWHVVHAPCMGMQRV